MAKHIAAPQAGPMVSHVNHNNDPARKSATKSATGDAILNAICTRIEIQNDIDSILALALTVNGVQLKVGTQKAHFKDATSKIKALHSALEPQRQTK